MITLTDAEWTALEGWREAGEHNWEEGLGASGLDAVRWAEEDGRAVPGDVDQDAAQGWLFFRRMKGRIAARRIATADLAALQTYGEALSWDETAESSVDRSAWEKVSAYTGNPDGGAPWWLWPAVGFAGAILAAGVAARLWRWRQARRAPLAETSADPAPPHGGGGGGASGGTTEAPAEPVYNGGWESQDEAAGLSEQREGGLPLSDRMRLNANCNGPAAKTVKWRYDIRLTNYFWHLWDKGERDPVLLTMDLLALDSPQCAWPPDLGAAEWADVIWEGTLAAVSNYVGHIEAGTLSELGYDPHDPHEGMHVKPLVVWA